MPPVWNKGKYKIGTILNIMFKPRPLINSSQFKKGKHASPKTEFKKGNKFPKEIEERRLKKVREILRKRNKDPKFRAKAIRGRMKRPTSLEKKMIEIIQKHNLPYKYVGDGSFMIGFKNPDFINTDGKKIAIEVYAKIFKKFSFGDINKWKEERQEIFAKYGWDLLFFDENELKKEKEVIMKIR